MLSGQQISIKEAKRIPGAKAALDKEWANLWAIKTWDANTVCEYDEVCNRAKKSGKTAHFGRVFGICTLKGSELPEGTPAGFGKEEFVFRATR